MTRMHVHLIPVLLCAAAGVQAVQAADAPTGGASAKASPPTPVSARWVTRKFDFTYMGFTAHFSCDGLRDDLRDILLKLGARKEDLDLREPGCIRLDGPTAMPQVAGTFAVLVPESDIKPTDVMAPPPKTAAGAPAATDPLPAQWRSVDLVRDLRLGFDLTGSCELLEQVKRDLLPLMTSRNLNFRATCVPHTETIGGVTFKLDVLTPVPAPKPAKKS